VPLLISFTVIDEQGVFSGAPADANQELGAKKRADLKVCPYEIFLF